MKKIFITFASFLLAISSYCQITFDKNYDIYYSAYADLVFCQDDGYLMGMIGIKDKYYFSLVKTDLYGDTLWTKNYDLGLVHMADLFGTEDEQGNLYIACQEFANGNLLKLDKDGNIIWARNHSTMKNQILFKHNILWICGDTWPGGNYIFKIDPATGDSLWRSKIFNYDSLHPGLSHATSMVVLDNDEVVVTVSDKIGFEPVPMPSHFYKLPVNSDTVVEFTLETGEDKYVVSDSKSVGNDIISIANKFAYDYNNDKTCYLIRYTADGTVQTFAKEIFGYNFANLYRCVVTNQNQVVAMGGTLQGMQEGNIMLHCFSMDGDSLWTQLFGNSSYNGWMLKIAGDDGFVITGSFEYDFNHDRPLLIKTNSLGLLTSVPDLPESSKDIVYPNPASDVAVFKTPGISSGKLTILDRIGRVCNELQINSEKTLWNCSDVQPGIYVYRIVGEKEILSGKLVVE